MWKAMQCNAGTALSVFKNRTRCMKFGTQLVSESVRGSVRSRELLFLVYTSCGNICISHLQYAFVQPLYITHIIFMHWMWTKSELPMHLSFPPARHEDRQLLASSLSNGRPLFKPVTPSPQLHSLPSLPRGRVSGSLHDFSTDEKWQTTRKEMS